MKFWLQYLTALFVDYLISLGEMLSFVHQPTDIIVKETEEANFSCTYSGAGGVVSWIINGLTVTLNMFPLNHRPWYYTNGQVLMVTNVNLQQNGSTYQCTLTGESTFMESSIGVLIVCKYELNMHEVG